ncbi:F-box/kelch-repeat protein At3g06240-like [Salvia hispanica]|uniref:F-box/kelch-repeat protein At3g06240-like n=1 Tax=Salvia hispanica TaxID=49212 RepID=UPI0020095F60|nr:F-box/kelch-repeat protein At3g06240-like [Salvia hispanica]
MGEDFFRYLPSEIVLDILSRLPTQDAMACKCVCKPWLVLLATPEFVNFHLSRSVPGIVVETHSTRSYDVIEAFNSDEEHFRDVTFNFKLPFDEPIHSSADGLIFLKDDDFGDLILCNPITRDYIKLPFPPQTTSAEELEMDTFGFGVSRTTGQYKAVRVFEQDRLPFECQVYTVGTGLWRKVPSDSLLSFFYHHKMVLLNGNLHLMALEMTIDGMVEHISCLDLETEVFSTFSIPDPEGLGFSYCRMASVFRDCLCLSHITADGEIVIWLMKEYGDDNSWVREVFVCEVAGGFFNESHVWPIRVFENGDILMECDGKPFYYSKKTKTFDYDTAFRGDRFSYISMTIYTSSFVSLKNFAMENVSSF